MEKSVELQQKFTDLIQINEELDVIFLFDSSGSITATDFNRAKRMGGTFVWKFGEHVYIGIAQFGSIFLVECDVTDQRKQAAFAVQSMVQLNGGTAMHTALAGTIEMFKRGRASAQKYLIVITDGMPDDKSLALRQAELVRSEGITLICVGIGERVNKEYLHSLASADCSYSIDSYSDLLKQLPSTATFHTRKGIPNSEVNIVLSLVGDPIAFVGAAHPPKIKMQVELINMGRVPVERGSRITILDEQKQPFFRKKIVPIPAEIPVGESWKIEVLIDVCAGAKISNIPKFVKVNVTNPNNLEYWTEVPESYLPMDYFVGDLLKWTLNPHVTGAEAANVLFFGWNGAGKSTLVNKGISLVNNGVRRVSPVRFGNQSTTSGRQEYRIEGAPVNLVDSPGVSMDLYAKGEFSFMLSGILPNDWDITRKSQNDDEIVVNIDREQMCQKKIHAVVFVYPINSLDDSNSMNKMRQFIDSCIRNQHYQPILILTFGDYVPVADHPARKLKAHQELGIVLADIYIIDNNDASDEKDTNVYRTVYEVIFKAVKYAEERMKRYPEA